MPVNAPAEYFKAEEKLGSAKNKEEKIAALEEMIRLLPKHHGSENMHAQLKARLAKLRRAGEKKGARKVGIKKEGEAQICLIGLTNSGKSSLLAKLTDAKPSIGEYEYTTTKPEIGMMDYEGIKIQLIEIPSRFEPENISIARTSDMIVLIIKEGKDEKPLKELLEKNYVHIKYIIVNPWKEDEKEIKERVWSSLNLIIVYTKKTSTPMALPKNSTIRDFTQRIHKDFIKNFRFARLWRNKRVSQVGLNYELKNRDVVEIHTK